MKNEGARPGLSVESLNKVLEVTQKLAAPFSLHTMLTEIVEAGSSALDADLGTLWICDQDSGNLVIRVPALDPPAEVAPGVGLVGECLVNRKTINVPDCSADSRFQGAVDKATGYKTLCLLNVPLIGSGNEPVGVMQLHNKRSGAFDAADETLAMAVAAQCAVALQRSRLIGELLEKEHLHEEVELARELQMSTLPEQLPSIPGYDLHGYFLPAGRAGGDLYDLEMINEQLFILLGDATGHGFGPALSATQMQAMLRVAFRLGANLDDAYLHVNNQMTEDLPDDRFVTAFMGFLDPVKHNVAYHSGGQGPILHFCGESKKCDWYKPTNFPVGVIDIDDAGDSMVLDLAAGDLLVLLSDGIYEYHNPLGEQFGEKRVADVVMGFHHDSMSTLCEQLMAAVIQFADKAPQQDDITMVLIRRLPAD